MPARGPITIPAAPTPQAESGLLGISGWDSSWLCFFSSLYATLTEGTGRCGQPPPAPLGTHGMFARLGGGATSCLGLSQEAVCLGEPVLQSLVAGGWREGHCVGTLSLPTGQDDAEGLLLGRCRIRGPRISFPAPASGLCPTEGSLYALVLGLATLAQAWQMCWPLRHW